MRRTHILLMSALTLICCTSLLAQKRSITEKDLFAFKWVGDPQISPDGTRVAFVRVVVNEKKDGYETSLWIVGTGTDESPQPLTFGKHDVSPRWSPDGKRIAFLRAPEREGKPAEPQIALLSMTGGEAWVITKLPKGAGSPVWSPDGRRIAFTSTTSPDDLAKQRRAASREEQNQSGESAQRPPKEAQRPSPEAQQQPGIPAEQTEGSTGDTAHEHTSDVRVITKAVYRMNGPGYLDEKHPTHIWNLTLPLSMAETATPKLLTPGKFNEEDPVWARDGSVIYFTSTQVEEPYYELPRSDIYSISPEGGDVHKLVALNLEADALSLSPDGKRVAFTGSSNNPVRSYTQPDLWVVDLAPGATAKNLTASFDYDIGSGVGGDNAPPRAAGQSRPIWSADGQSILDVVSKEGIANLYRFDAANGQPTEVTHGKQAVEHFTASQDGSRVVVRISTPTNVGDLFLVERGAEQRRLTNLNDKLFSSLSLSDPEEIWYTSFDGKKIQAWIQKPPDFTPGKKYPLILDIHGGPHAAYGYTFDHEFQWMAAKGYVVLYPNPRGSTSYGQEFGNVIQYRYPGDDFKDLMAGVDEVIKRGYIDPKKLGVTGGSGGGLLTNWVVGHTNRFAAAVSQRDIADWESWWYTADFTLFQPTWFKAPPFLGKQDFESRSPITYIQSVTTPLMLVLGEADYRTPPTSGGEQMFRALKFLKKPVIMVRFPGETHELSRSGQPWHRIERLQHIVGWFDKYLQGVDVPAYRDVMQTTTTIPNPNERRPNGTQQSTPPHLQE